MDDGRRYRLERELARNLKRIEDCMTEAEILEDRNSRIKRELESGTDQKQA